LKGEEPAVTDRRYSGNRHERKESERFKSFTYEDLIKRDKPSSPNEVPGFPSHTQSVGASRRKAGAPSALSLDIFWLKDEALEDSANLPAPEIIAADILEDLQAALAQFAEIAADLKR
jgi:type I restriction enzyme M protein